MSRCTVCNSVEEISLIHDRRIETGINCDDATAHSPWLWHPPTLHSSADSEPLPSDLLVLPCGELSRHADLHRQNVYCRRCFAEWNPNLIGCCIITSCSWYYAISIFDYWLQTVKESIFQNSQCYGRQEMRHSEAVVKQCWGGPWKQLHGWESDQTRERKRQTGRWAYRKVCI